MKNLYIAVTVQYPFWVVELGNDTTVLKMRKTRSTRVAKKQLEFWISEYPQATIIESDELDTIRRESK